MEKLSFSWLLTTTVIVIITIVARVIATIVTVALYEQVVEE